MVYTLAPGGRAPSCTGSHSQRYPNEAERAGLVVLLLDNGGLLLVATGRESATVKERAKYGERTSET